MIGNAFVATVAVMLAAFFYLLQVGTFLIPYRRLLLEEYGLTFALWAAVVFVNLFAAFYAIGRTLFLKDTGDKLAHLEKQIRSGHSLADDLTHRLRG